MLDEYWFDRITKLHYKTWELTNERGFNIDKICVRTWSIYDENYMDIDWNRLRDIKYSPKQKLQLINMKNETFHKLDLFDTWIEVNDYVEIDNSDMFVEFIDSNKISDDNFINTIAEELWVSKKLCFELVICLRDVIIKWLKKYWFVKIKWFGNFEIKNMPVWPRLFFFGNFDYRNVMDIDLDDDVDLMSKILDDIGDFWVIWESDDFSNDFFKQFNILNDKWYKLK